jgi:glycopeptide antibiotics resistance protein
MGDYGIWPLVAFATLCVALLGLLLIQPTSRRSLGPAIGVAISIASVVSATLGPGGKVYDSKLRLDPTADLEGLHMLGNIVLFVPFGGFLALLRVSRPKAIFIAAILSAVIEALQLLFIEGRYAATSDVILNTAGAALGYVAVTLVEPRRG